MKVSHAAGNIALLICFRFGRAFAWTIICDLECNKHFLQMILLALTSRLYIFYVLFFQYLDECKGLKREDLERLSRKAKEREERHKDGGTGPNRGGHREPLLELPPPKDMEEGQTAGGLGPMGGAAAFAGGDVDLRIPIPPSGGNTTHSVGDMDYRLPSGDQRDNSRLQPADQDERLDRPDRKGSPPRTTFYRDTIESPRAQAGSPNNRRVSVDTVRDRSPNSTRRRSSESNDLKR